MSMFCFEEEAKDTHFTKDPVTEGSTAAAPQIALGKVFKICYF